MTFDFFTTNNNTCTLKELSHSSYEIADGQPDITGWAVKNNDGEIIGDVEELLFDPEQRKVRYMIINLDEDYFNYDDHKVIVPIGLAELHEEEDEVILPAVTGDQLAMLPVYVQGRLTEEMENKVRSIF